MEEQFTSVEALPDATKGKRVVVAGGSIFGIPESKVRAAFKNFKDGYEVRVREQSLPTSVLNGSRGLQFPAMPLRHSCAARGGARQARFLPLHPSVVATPLSQLKFQLNLCTAPIAPRYAGSRD